MYIGGQCLGLKIRATVDNSIIRLASGINTLLIVALPHCLQNHPTRPGASHHLIYRETSADFSLINRIKNVMTLITRK